MRNGNIFLRETWFPDDNSQVSNQRGQNPPRGSSVDYGEGPRQCPMSDNWRD